MKTLLKNGTVVSGDMSVIEDVLIDGEKIVKVGRNLEAEDAQVVDVNGKLLFPGFIDGHTHFDLEVAGTVTADDFETGTRAAIAGGTTLVIDYASQDKGGHTLKEGLEKWHKKADGKCSCDYSFHMSVVEWNEETEREIQDMINEGITSFKLYMTYPAMIVDDGDLYKIIKKLNEYGCFEFLFHLFVFRRRILVFMQTKHCFCGEHPFHIDIVFKPVISRGISFITFDFSVRFIYRFHKIVYRAERQFILFGRSNGRTRR